ncbi:MAG: hypothetical protein ABL997_08655 [Planctomycetota bacterium]
MMNHPTQRVAAAIAFLLSALPLLGQTSCGTPHLVGLPHPSGNSGTALNGIAQFGPSDIWAVGDSIHTVQGESLSLPMTLHWDGSRFVEVPAPSVSIPGNPGSTWCELRAVDGVASNDVWAGGRCERQHPLNGTIGFQVFLLHWNGTAWSQVPAPITSPAANGAWIDTIIGFASNDVWFFGYTTRHDPFPSRGPLTMHWDGSNVSVVDVAVMPGAGSSANRSWVDVDALSPTEFWGVADVWPGPGLFSPYVGRWNGSSWTQVAVPTLPNTYYRLYAVEAIAANDVWVTGSEGITPTVPYAIHWNGSTWTRRPTSGYARSLVAYASNDVWAFGNKIEHWNGTAWSVVTDYSATLANAPSLDAVAVGPCDMWTVGTQWASSNGPPVQSLAAHIGSSSAGNARLRLPCTTPRLAQSLLPLATPRVGQAFRIVVDDPAGVAGLVGPQATAWWVAFGPGPLAPCGALVPGLGVAGAPIEVMLDSSATFVSTSVWNVPGQPAEHAVIVPNDPFLVGMSLASQAAFVGAAGIVATSAVDLVIGQ